MLKGLGCYRKNTSMKDVIKKNRADVVMIQETKNMFL